METKFNFNSQVCTDKVQSERLLALGLKKETRDAVLKKYIHNNKYCYKPVFEDIEDCLIDCDDLYPAWSLHRLWELLPKSFWYNNGLEKKYHPIIEYGFVNYVTECGMELFDFDCGYEVWGSMIVVIEWLIKEGYFPNEYLKKM